MTDYIKRDDIIKALFAREMCYAPVQLEIVKALPAADVVPVVRCKDCEYARDLGFQFGSLVHESWFCIYNGPHTTGANDFCSHGQKREEGEIEDDP